MPTCDSARWEKSCALTSRSRFSRACTDVSLLQSQRLFVMRLTDGKAASAISFAASNSDSSLRMAHKTPRASVRMEIREYRSAIDAARMVMENPLICCPPAAKIFAFRTRRCRRCAISSRHVSARNHLNTAYRDFGKAYQHPTSASTRRCACSPSATPSHSPPA